VRDGRGARHEVVQPRESVGAILVLAPVALRLDDDDAVGADPLIAVRKEALLDGVRQ